MAILEVLHFPDDRLKKVAQPVQEITPATQIIIDNMLATMYAEEGIGLAAVQVNILQRIVVIDTSEKRNQPLTFINPVITATSGESGIEEGCLSVPESRAFIPRAEFVTVTALDRDGNEFTLETDGLLAICLQHELDHLNGKLFIDYLSPLKQQRIRKKLEKLARQHK